jgi:acyl-CoA synthetase (AMP-forming)/AMP-acid ligase II
MGYARTAAVIGVKHPTWEERPLLVIVKAAGATVDKRDVLQYLSNKIVKWWMPDDVVFVDSLPMTSTGKISKLDLRRRFADHLLKKT